MAAPTVSLYVPTVSAARMAPCPVSARLDVGAIQKSIRNGSYSWSTVNTGTVYSPVPQIDNDNLDGDETADDTTAESFTNLWIDINSSSSSATRTNAIMIFPSITIASGKSIISATIEAYTGGTGQLKCVVYGEDVDDAANLTTTADINGRTKTTANVTWDTGGAVTNNTWIESPDLSSVLQEIYDRNGSLSGVNVAFILEAASDITSNARLNGYAAAEGADFAPKLNIEYADAPLLDEYKLDTTLAGITDSGDAPSNIIVRENGTIIPEGTVGSLASGEWGQSSGELYIRLTDDADPEAKDADYIDITYDVTLSGQGGSTNIGGSSPGWTVSTGSEYTLDTAIPSLAASIPNHSRIRIKEGSGLSGIHLQRGDAGSLSAGEYDIVSETLHVRLSDSSNPDLASAADVVLEYELYASGLHVAWEVNSSGSGVSSWGSRYRYSTDPRSETSSQQIDHAGKQTSGNGPNGMCYMWVFDVADTYTISATVTNTDGDSTTETTSGIVVAADSRTEYTVGSDPEDDDTSLASLIGTIGASTSDIKIVVDDGHTENVTAEITAITGNNWWITTGTTSGTKPVLTYSDATDFGIVDFTQFEGENALVERVTLAESTGNTGDGTGSTIFLIGFNALGTNGAFVECQVNGNDSAEGAGGLRLAHAFRASNNVGTLMLNCTTQVTRSYSIIGPSSAANPNDIVCCFGSSLGPSTNESTVRSVQGAKFWNISWNELTGDGSKSTLRWSWGDYMHGYGNSSVDGDNHTGATVTTPAAAEIRVSNVRFEANKFTGTVSAAGLIAGITQATEGVFAASNQLSSAGFAYLTLGNAISGSGLGHKKWGITLAHNTIIGEDTFDSEFMIGGTTTELDHARNRVVNNLFVHEDPADMTEDFITIGSAIAQFNGNVWPATQTNLARFADIYVAGLSDSTPANLTAWNALSFVGTDTETDVTLDADLIPDSPTTVTTEPGVHYDYYGNARDSTSYAGAVIAANPSSGGGSNRNLLLLGVG